MTDSEAGVLQDAILCSGLVPTSAIPTIAATSTWTDVDVAAIVAWIASGGRHPTPRVLHGAISQYYAPRPSGQPIIQHWRDREHWEDECEAIRNVGRDVGRTVRSKR